MKATDLGTESLGNPATPLLHEGWRCFHCDFFTTDEKEAEAHFGEDSGDPAICLFWYRQTPEERMAEFQTTTRELNAERDENATLRRECERLEWLVGNQKAEMQGYKPFRECTSIRDIFNLYDSMEGRALAAEEKLREQADFEQEKQRLKNVIVMINEELEPTAERRFCAMVLEKANLDPEPTKFISNFLGAFIEATEERSTRLKEEAVCLS